MTMTTHTDSPVLSEGSTEGGVGDDVLPVYDVAEAPSPREIARFVNERGLRRVSALDSTLRVAALFVAWPALYLVGRWAGNELVWWIVWIAMALVFEGFGSVVHEASHDKLYASRRANEVAGWLGALPRLYNFPSNKAFHLHHHRFTNDPERDSEPVFESMGLVDYLLYMLGSHLVFTGMLFYQGALAMTPWRSPWFATRRQQHRAVVGSVVVLLSAVLLVLGFVYVPLFTVELWLMPWLLCNSFVTSFVTQGEHFGTALSPPGSILTTTRTTRSNRFHGFFLWHNNFHTAHHLVPSLPGPALRELHEYIAPHVRYEERSYSRYHFKLLRRLLRHPVARSAGNVAFWRDYGARTSHREAGVGES